MKTLASGTLINEYVPSKKFMPQKFNSKNLTKNIQLKSSHMSNIIFKSFGFAVTLRNRLCNKYETLLHRTKRNNIR